MVGVCGFKAPLVEGVVEIAYFTFRAFERRGHATGYDWLLCGMARMGAHTVVAHTLLERNPSDQALARCGFCCDGEVIEPEDGKMWRWSKRIVSDQLP